MSSIFNYYPFIKYNNVKADYILARAVIVNDYLSDYSKFYTYTVLEGERADIVAYKQYGDSSLDWVIYLSNNIIDPYYDWPLSPDDLSAYLQDKYGVPAYTLTSVTNPSSIAYYYYKGLDTDTPEYIAGFNYTMTPESYAALGQPAGWVAKSIWDDENEKNEAKRTILLLRPAFVDDFIQQFNKLFVNG